MRDPYEVLGLPSDCDDDTIRRRYLELVREFTPEHHPQKFATIRAAYEQLKDLETRVRQRIFEIPSGDGLQSLIEEVTCRSSRQRVSLKVLLNTVQQP